MTCQNDGCDGAVFVQRHGLCRKHYHHLTSHPFYKKKSRNGAACIECDDPNVYCKDLCRRHYRKARRAHLHPCVTSPDFYNQEVSRFSDTSDNSNTSTAWSCSDNYSTPGTCVDSSLAEPDDMDDL